jgi:hypothetical protein
MASFRSVISFNEVDRYLHDDMVASIQFLRDYQIKSAE